MTNDLSKIQEFIQALINAISAILNVGVTVVDKDLIRISATAHYSSYIGQRIRHSSFYENIIATGQPGLIKNPKNANLCRHCAYKDECLELADIAYPIFLNGEVSGIISIIAFTEEEKSNLLNNNRNFEAFLHYMSMLIESKLSTYDHSLELENQLDEVINLSRRQLHETGFIGKNQQINEILSLIFRIRSSDSTVLISGESGTGKEVLAKVIHDASTRGNKLMISINCGAIPEHLVESELFGYEGGAFTGAKREGQAGKFELANDSTLFLDEIGEMSLAAQTKLLRVLQEKEVQRIGGKHAIPVNVRIICATNQNLQKLVEEQKFRMDLYYRINVIPIEIPPLRKRPDDIPLFIDTFTSLFNRQLKKRVTIATTEVRDILVRYPWPGNVRELKNIVEYLINIKDAGEVQVGELPAHLLISGERSQRKSLTHPLKTLLADYERHILADMLIGVKNAEDKKRVANQLDIGLATLYRKIAEYEL